MSVFVFLKSQKMFLIYYVIIMLLTASIIWLSEDDGQSWDNILYINLLSLIITLIYLSVRYYHERTFYYNMKGIIHRDVGDTFDLSIRPGNLQQKLYFELLKSLNKNYDKQMRKLQEEKQDHSDFILSWIHEVKLPIAASRLIMENSEGKTIDYLIDKWEDELGKIDNYVEQALYYSRIDSFSNDYFITEVELNQIIKNNIKKHAKIFVNKHIDVTMFEEKQYIQSDEKWLTYILDQIVSNSLKYTMEGGSIRFAFEEDGKERVLHVIDTGVGIAPEDIGRVFDKGFTGSNGRYYAKSTGMGLYLAKQMAIKLGHDILIVSEEGVYTKVSIHFPKTRSYLTL